MKSPSFSTAVSEGQSSQGGGPAREVWSRAWLPAEQVHGNSGVVCGSPVLAAAGSTAPACPASHSSYWIREHSLLGRAPKVTSRGEGSVCPTACKMLQLRTAAGRSLRRGPWTLSAFNPLLVTQPVRSCGARGRRGETEQEVLGFIFSPETLTTPGIWPESNKNLFCTETAQKRINNGSSVWGELQIK